ncbi:hypothetical protein [Limnoraphis robusta]|uniref:RAMP superfamily protein n=1 Tax=Limnoraphis robusta CCNP1315 TaxID=3110306 RepID=A0ABU5TV93_9CYAN|nr:hypothetical protein [Limnoraphis robusta]MEA5518814.1 hypothetical protein [Limnoraphis robusta CCNP1315]
MKNKHSQANDWAKEWTELYPEPPSKVTAPKKVDPLARPSKPPSLSTGKTQADVLTEPPKFGCQVKTRKYTLSWRLVTNSGVDDSIIRPVIGAKGYPYYPGSSMKGAFRRACDSDKQAIVFCGQNRDEKEDIAKQGILRFHGAYPVDTSWKKSLVDVIHPQYRKQVIQDETTSTKAQISLYRLEMQFGISSTIPMDQVDWDTVWNIWEKALGYGIGSRVSAGYGRFEKVCQYQNILQIHLQGQGIASTLLNRTPEFRINMFKAGLRGHTLRLFGGLTNEENAQKLTDDLWGNIESKEGAILGLLGVGFEYGSEPNNLAFSKHYYTPPQKNKTCMDLYELKEGLLQIFINAKTEEEDELSKIAQSLVQFAMLFGGFGKSWRRANHRLFFKEYFKTQDKPMIGCHWQFTKDSALLYLPCHNLKKDFTNFLEDLRAKLKSWASKRIHVNTEQYAENWREAWYPYQDQRGGVQIWGRLALSQGDSKAIRWFHNKYDNFNSIKKKSLTGQMGTTGRIWHRMYPCYQNDPDGNFIQTEKYVELLTIFPDNSKDTKKFLNFLGDQTDFESLW